MKNAAVAFLLSLGICLFALVFIAAGRRQARLEGLVARLDERGRAVEGELEKLRRRDAEIVPALRDCGRRGESLEERIRALEERAGAAPVSGGTGAGGAATREELDEVVAAVNELVDAVDDLSARVEASSQNRLALNTQGLTVARFSPDGSTLVYPPAATDGTVRLWDAAGGPELGRLFIGQGETLFEDVSLAAAPDPEAGTEEAEAQAEAAGADGGARER